MASRDLRLRRPACRRGGRDRLDASILVVEDRRSSADRLATALGQYHRVTIETDPHKAMARASEGEYDAAIVSLDLDGVDGLRLCSQLRSLDRTRNMPVVMLADSGDRARIMRGLDLGVHDYLMRPIDRKRAGGAGAHPGAAQALRPFPARIGPGLDGARGHGRADRSAQSALPRQPSRRCVRRAGPARPAGVSAPARHRPVSCRSTTASATMPATRCCGTSPTGSAPIPAASTWWRGSAARRSSCWWPDTGLDGARQVAERIPASASRDRAVRDPPRHPVGRRHGVDRGGDAPARRHLGARPHERGRHRALPAKEDGRNRVVAAAA